MSKMLTQLSRYRNQEIIADIDLELCRFLHDLHPDLPDEVLLAACLVSYLYRQGDVCLQLDEYAGEVIFDNDDTQGDLKAPKLKPWLNALAQSDVVGKPESEEPLILDKNRLYLQKSWQFEFDLAHQIIQKSNNTNDFLNVDLLTKGLNRLFSDESSLQKIAAASAVYNKLMVISGGPGTGKTYTVARILCLLAEQQLHSKKSNRIALAAPTGKAAAKLQNAISESKHDIDTDDEVLGVMPEEAQTLHQLLGAYRHRSTFKHNADNPLPYDTVIVDEASMIDQAMMSKLVDALLKDAQLILLGDKDQLASVEAGSVLGDICKTDDNRYSKQMEKWLKQCSLDLNDDQVEPSQGTLVDSITLLKKSYRFGTESGIAKLSEAVNAGDEGKALTLLNAEEDESTRLINPDNSTLTSYLGKRIPEYFKSIVNAETKGEAIKNYNQFRILAAHRRGPRGVAYINQKIKQLLVSRGLVGKYDEWYAGKPVMISVNDYNLELYNGDVGVCLPDANGDPKVYFAGSETPRSFLPARLPEHEVAYALTVHKSQGSEFEDLLLALPQKKSKVLSRELIYTAITRARTTITILGKKTVLRDSIDKRLHRSSGLENRLWDE